MASNNINIMIPMKNDMPAEINFLEWVFQRVSNPSIETMPSEVFNAYIEEYSQSMGVEPDEIEKLEEDYYYIGWTNVLERILSVFFSFHWHYCKSLDYLINRRYSNPRRYNCIILPLADKESQKQFKKLIKDEWKNLNDLSGDVLDIYYNEKDIGRTGYDIAERLRSLPNRLRKAAPCIILWNGSITGAKDIPTDGLNAAQIRNTIKTVVHQIQAESDFDTIVQEARRTVKEQQELTHGVTHYNITGDGNVIGDHNKIKTTIVKGKGNIVSSDDISQKKNEFDQEIDKAIKSIIESDEIKEKTKEQLVAVMEEARQAEREQSEEKRTSARTKFDVIKEILTDVAPKLITSLLDLSKIAAFFGLGV